MSSGESLYAFARVVVHSVDVERVVLIAALKPGAREHALDLLQRSAEASEQERVMQRQGIFLFDRDAEFFFEGGDAGASVRELRQRPGPFDHAQPVAGAVRGSVSSRPRGVLP